jgi:uncharacterized membrane protein
MNIFFASPHFSLQGFDFYIGLFLYFGCFCILGWFVEMCYLATSGRGLINSGFLQGPFCPAYAAGVVIIYPFTVLFGGQPLWLQAIVYAGLATIIEYVAHLSLEKILGIRIWDYSDEFMNLNGRISLKYTIFWFILVMMLVLIIQPFVIWFIESIPVNIRHWVAGIFAVLLTLDYLVSAILYSGMKKKIQKICTVLDLPLGSMQELQFNRPRIMNEKKRLAKLFKDGDYVELNCRIEQALFSVPSATEAADKGRYAFGFDPTCYTDILDNEVYRNWRTSNDKRQWIYRRYLRIAELAWYFCRLLELDGDAAARGVLMAAFRSDAEAFHTHIVDFFVPQRRILLAVKRRIGPVGRIEKDIILRYKWPLNLTSPHTGECLCASFAEKLVQSREFRKELARLYQAVLGGEVS